MNTDYNDQGKKKFNFHITKLYIQDKYSNWLTYY